MNDGTIFNEVQAALLNSECSPKYAVERAMLALVQFANWEADMSEDEVRDAVAKAWKQGRELGYW